jgi:hypothetical protein
VIFQTLEGSRGNDADFAFSGYAAVVSSDVFGPGSSMASVPVMPMADGDDNVNPTLNFRNSVINDPPIGGFGEKQIAAAPITSGMRMNNADGRFDEVWVEMPIQGIAVGSPRSMHVLWFDQDIDNRLADLIVWDDMEGFCSDRITLSHELNIWMYNHEYDQRGFGTAVRSWNNLVDFGAPFVDRALTNVIEAVEPSNILTGYASETYCAPEYWVGGQKSAPAGYVGAIFGNVTYKLDEENPGTTGDVDAAGVAFHWQESVFGGMPVMQTRGTPSDGASYRWSSHPATELGVMD